MPPAIAWTPTRAAPAAPPPRPEPGFFENVGANFRLNEDRQDLLEQAPRNLEAYRSALETLGDLGVDTSEGGPLFSTADSGTIRKIRTINRPAIFAEMQRQAARNGAYFKGLPATQEDYDREIARRRGGRDADLATASRGGTVSGLIGSAASGLTDPVNWITGLAGGGEARLARFVLNEGVAGAIGGAALLPDEAAAMARMGEDFTALDMAKEVGMSAAGNVALGVAGKYVAAPVARSASRRVANAFAARIPEGSRTADETAALTILNRDADIEEANPFRPDGAGAKAHGDALAAAGAKLVNPGEARLAKPRARPAAGKRLDPASALGFIVDRLEGGSKLVRDSGGLTRFGISKDANPDIDVANLTRTEAMAIYRRRYWEPLGLDRAPADTAMVTLDAAVNHGVAFARRALRESGGDPAALIALRRGEYARLIAADPGKYGKYAKGWENRLRQLEQNVGLRRGEAAVAGRAADEDAPDWRDELDARDAALAAERDALDAEQRALRERSDAETSAVREPVAEAFDPGPAPEQRRDLFPDEASWRAAQDGVDAQHYDLAAPRERMVDAGDWRDIDKLFDAPDKNGVSLAQRRTAAREHLFGDALQDGALDDVLGRAKADELTAAARAVEAGDAPREVFDRLADEDALRAVARWDAAESDIDGLLYQREAGRPDKALASQLEKRLAKRGFPPVPESLTSKDFPAVRRWLAENRPTRAVSEDGGDPEFDFARAAASPAAIERQQASAREALVEWDDPAGPAAVAQTGSVLHDLKATAALEGGPEVAVQLDGEGGAVSLEAMLDDIAEDFAIVAAIKGCL